MIDSDRFSEKPMNNLFFRETEQNFLPLQVVDNLQLDDGKQVVIHKQSNEQFQGAQPISELARQHQTPLVFQQNIDFTSKPQCQPIISKNLSSGEHERDSVDEASQKKIKQQSSNNLESNSDGKSSPQQGFQRPIIAKKTLRRMNSRIRARQSVVLQRPFTVSYTTKIQNLIESLAFSITMAIVTIYALFGDDIRVLTVNKDGDDAFFGLTIVCIVFFTLEIVFTCKVWIIPQLYMQIRIYFFIFGLM